MAGMKNESSEFPPFFCAWGNGWLKIVKFLCFFELESQNMKKAG